MNLSIKNLKISGDNCDMMVIKYISGYHHDCDDDQEEDGGDKCREVGHPIGRAFHPCVVVAHEDPRLPPEQGSLSFQQQLLKGHDEISPLFQAAIEYEGE